MKALYIIVLAISLLAIAGCDLNDPTEGLQVADVISITTADGNNQVFADGQSRKGLIVSLGSEVNPGQTVLLMTEAGRFAAADDSDPQSLEVFIPSKQANVTLITDTEVRQEVIVTALLSGYQADYKLQFSRRNPDNLVVNAEKLSIKSDRIDFADIQISLSLDEAGQPSERSKIEFETIPQDTATLDVVPFVFAEEGEATVRVRSKNGKPGSVQLRISVNGSSGTLEEVLEFLVM